MSASERLNGSSPATIADTATPSTRLSNSPRRPLYFGSHRMFQVSLFTYSGARSVRYSTEVWPQSAGIHTVLPSICTVLMPRSESKMSFQFLRRDVSMGMSTPASYHFFTLYEQGLTTSGV